MDCTTIHHMLRAPRRIVGQVFRGTPWVRRIVNPPAALVRARHGLGESPTPFAACRYVGQDYILRAGFQPVLVGLFTSHSGGLPTQCHSFFPAPNTCINCGADAPVRSRPPGRLFVCGKHLILRAKGGSRGTRADQGVCPTSSVTFPVFWKNEWHWVTNLPRSSCRIPVLGKVSGIAL
jgi:hypothetical protein